MYFCLIASDCGGIWANEESIGSWIGRGGSVNLPRQRPQMVETSGSDSYPSSSWSSSLTISMLMPLLVFCLFAALFLSPPFFFDGAFFLSINFRYRRETCLKVRPWKYLFWTLGQNIGLTLFWLQVVWNSTIWFWKHI